MGNKIGYTASKFERGRTYSPAENYLAFNKEELQAIKIHVLTNEQSKHDLSDFIDSLMRMLESI